MAGAYEIVMQQRKDLVDKDRHHRKHHDDHDDGIAYRAADGLPEVILLLVIAGERPADFLQLSGLLADGQKLYGVVGEDPGILYRFCEMPASADLLHDVLDEGF